MDIDELAKLKDANYFLFIASISGKFNKGLAYER